MTILSLPPLASRFPAPSPEVDTKRYQVSNITVELNGKNVQLKHFILGYEGDFTLNLNEFSQDNITGNKQDQLLFVGARNSTKELLAIHGTKSNVKTVYDVVFLTNLKKYNALHNFWV